MSKPDSAPPSLYEISAASIEGKPRGLAEYRGKVLLIVNTASECGFTPQFKELEETYQKYQSKGLVILGFPCNQFGGQDPGTDGEIAQFCQRNYGVSFPMFSKVDVNGANAHPLYQFLKSSKKGFLGTEMIKWNFTKFLIDKNGNVVERFAPNTKPSAIHAEIERLLA